MLNSGFNESITLKDGCKKVYCTNMNKNHTPKGHVANMASWSFPDATTIIVNGRRAPKTHGGKFHAELVVDGKLIAEGVEHDWRIAYKTLALRISKCGVL